MRPPFLDVSLTMNSGYVFPCLTLLFLIAALGMGAAISFLCFFSYFMTIIYLKVRSLDCIHENCIELI